MLEECDIGVFLLTKGYHSSIWMPYEFREFVHKPGGPIFPLLFDVERNDLLGPFRLHQSYDFDDVSFRLLLERIATNVSPQQCERLDHRWKDLKNDVREILGKTNEKVESEILIQALSSAAANLGAAESDLATAAKQLASVVDSRESFTALGKLASNIHLAEKHPGGGSRWAKLWKRYTNKFLADAILNTGRVARRGEITLRHPDEARDFWREEIMGNTKESLWATNLPGTFGRKTDAELLQAQRKAISEGVEITRLFLYVKNDEEDCRNVREAARQQIEAGIDIWALREDAFKWYDTDLHTEIGSRDFIILDDRYVHVTRTNRFGVSKVIFKEAEDVLDAARRLKNRLMPYADKVEIREDGRIDLPPGWADRDKDQG
jgi:hypothetical protein